MSRPLLAAGAAAIGLAARSARAEPAPAEPTPVVSRSDSPPADADGVYGRFDGDLDFSVAAGGAIAQEGPGGAAMARVLFLQTTGLYAAYTDVFGKATSTAPPRSFAFGLAIRPLFIPRWAYNRQRGPAIVDLTIDATTLDLGVLFCADERGRFTQAAGIELALGTEVPLAGRAAGPWIGVRGALRWRGSELSGATDPYPPLGPSLLLTFAWHFVANAHLVDIGDEILR